MNGNTLRRLKPLFLLLFMLLAYLFAYVTGLTERFSREELRLLISSAGLPGVAAFFLLFAVGALLHMPAMLFIGSGILAYGALWGGIISFFAGLSASLISFALVRAIGGQVLVQIEQPWVRRMLKRLEDRPISTLIALRSFLWVSPPLNYALAMTGLRFRDFAIGSAIGLVGPMAFISVFFDWLFR